MTRQGPASGEDIGGARPSRVPAPVSVRRSGPTGLLAEYRDTATVLAAAAAVRALAPLHLTELVPAERTLLLRGSTAGDASALHELLGRLPAAPAPADEVTTRTLSVVYDGEDLEGVAESLGMSTQALVAAHTDTLWTAAFGGFAPGFAYLLPAGDAALTGGDDRGRGDGAGAGSAPVPADAPGSSDGGAGSSAVAAGSSGDAADAEGAERTEGPPWEVPRRQEPRSRVPAGAVALASRYSAVYPRPSPGGWQLIGTTEAVLFDAERTPPTLLPPGTRVRFEARRPTALVSGASSTLARAGRQVSAASTKLARLRSGRAAPGAGAPLLELLSPGPLTLLEDGGRPGRADIGVPSSGAFDRTALVRANLTVGNPGRAAGLEALMGPLQLRALGAAVVALEGASAPVSVRRHDRDSPDLERPASASAGAPIALDPGDVLQIGPVTAGLRMVLAVRGGIRAVRPTGEGPTVGAVLGSLSRDTLSDLGPAPLQAGDVLLVGDERGLDAVPGARDEDDLAGRSDPDRERDPADGGRAGARSPLEVEIDLGPRDDLLGSSAVTALLGTIWTVREDSDRVGVRLDGEALPVPDGAASLASEAMVPGAIQVPPSGLPVVFGPDHPTTGGYPVIGVVTPAGLDLLAQAAPGTGLRLRMRR